MELKPESFFIGVIDFFSILLPGAVVVYLAKTDLEPILFPNVFSHYTGEAAGWAVFLFASYLSGHFIFLLGSKLDDWVYEKIRWATPEGQRKRLANGEAEASRTTRWLASKMFGKNPDLSLEQVLKLKESRIPDIDGKAVINAFQWAKARLMLQCPTALLDVQRFEADSKFFRSLVIVLIVMAIWVSIKSLWAKPPQPAWEVVLISVILAFLSLWRYMERRFKATQQAYWYVLTLEHCPHTPEDKRHV
jgi:hypothetical protein